MTAFAQLFDLPEQGRIVGDDRTAVAVTAEVLSWVETEGSRLRVCADRVTTEPSTVCLGAVLDYAESMARSQSVNGRHVGHLSIHVNRNDRARALGYCSLN